MEYLLSKLLGHVATSLPEVNLVDEDYGQLENLDQSDRQMYPLVYPAVLIEPSEVIWSDLKGKLQIGEATLRVRLIIDCYDDTHIGSSSEYRLMEREDLRHRLHTLLEGYRPLDDGALHRSRSTFYTYRHGIKVYETEYKCRVVEQTASGRASGHTQPRIALDVGRLGQS